MWRDEAMPRLGRPVSGGPWPPHLPTDRHRRIAGGRDPRRDAPARRQPGGRDVRPRRGGRRSRVAPKRRPRDRGALVEDAAADSSSSASATHLGDGIDDLDGRRSASGMAMPAGAWRIVGVGTRGAVAALFGDVEWVVRAELVHARRRLGMTDRPGRRRRERSATPARPTSGWPSRRAAVSGHDGPDRGGHAGRRTSGRQDGIPRRRMADPGRRWPPRPSCSRP